MAESDSSTAKMDYGSTGKFSAAAGLSFSPDDSDLEDRMAERNITWPSAAWVINASVIGMGVLTIPSCFATLGWLVGMVALVLCLFANILVARLMLEVQELHPRAISLADAAQIASGGSRNVKVIFRSVLYAEKLACTCAFVNLMADTLGSAFYAVHWCEVTWCALIVIIFLPLMQLKNLHETFFLNIVNFLTILAVVILTCIVVVTSPRTERVSTTLLPAGQDFQTAFGAISMMVFAYSGNWMYFELMSEMRKPQEFMKAFTIAGPIQLGLYVLMGAICYGVMGRSVPASAVEALTFGPFMQAISFLLTVHIVCGTGTNMIVLIRFFHSRISPRDLNEETLRAKTIRTVIYLFIICGTMAVSLCIRGFGAIVTLIGAVFEAPINFVCPFVLYAGIMRGRPRRKTWSVFFLWVGGFLIACFGMATMVLGVMEAARRLGTMPSTGGGLLSCNCQDMWNTCECSKARMPAGSCPVQRVPLSNDVLSAKVNTGAGLITGEGPIELPLYAHHADHH